MAINYPSSLDSLAEVPDDAYMDDSGFEGDLVVNRLMAIVEALEAKLGIGSTTPNAIGKMLAVPSTGGVSSWDYHGPIKLAEAVLTTGAATIAFTAINASFRDLRVVVNGRGDTAAAAIGVTMRLADTGTSYDSGNNYDWYRITNTGAALTASESLATSGFDVGGLPAASAPSGAAGHIDVTIFDYAGSAFHKQMRSDSGRRQGTGSGDGRHLLTVGDWRDVGPVVALQLSASAGNFATGTKATLYGIP